MALGEVGENLHMLKDITNHLKQDCSVVITRVSLVEVPDASGPGEAGNHPSTGC